jgi:membrane fusion protein
MNAAARQDHGNVVLVYPVSNYFLLAGAFVLLAALGMFVSIGHYTRHVSVAGVLEPTLGVIKLYATQNGVLKGLHVHEGQRVRKGEVLLDFEMEHVGANGHAAEADIDSTLVRQLAALRSERGGTLQLSQVDMAKSKLNLTALEESRRAMRIDVETQTQRVRAGEETLARFEHLRASGFMPETQVQDKKNELTDQQLRLQSMQANLVNSDAEVTRLRMELASGPLRSQVAQDQLDRTISNVEADLTKQQINRVWKVIAPCDGVVTALAISTDQNATSGSPLVSIVPSNSKLQANLYAPSRSLGFLQAGQLVELKIDAFPFQKFGIVEGTVISIAETPLGVQERPASIRLATGAEADEPVYTIRVELSQSSLFAYGKEQKLRPGLQLEADIQLETRRLYEWILEPLYSLRRT